MSDINSLPLDRRTALLGLAGGLATLLAPGAALAQFGAGMGVGSAAQFRTMALMGGEFALQTSQLALQRARNPLVREFAQLESNEQVAYAGSLGATPGGVPLRPDQAQLLQQLSQTPPGSRFDRLYVRGQIIGHQELLALNSSYVQSGGSDTLGRAVANLAVPSIQTHLAILSRLQRA
jgi:putative membrane protein